MPRVKNRVASRAKRKKLLKSTSGNYGKRANCYSIAKDTFLRGGVYAYRDRKQKKRHFHSLWITRINAAARSNDISYSRFIAGLAKANVAIDRKILADMAINDPASFTQLAAIARES